MTLTDMIERVQQNVGEPVIDTGWFTPDSVADWVNAANNWVFQKILEVNADYWGIKTYTGSFVNDQQEYDLSSINPFEIRHVEITDQGEDYFLDELALADKNSIAYAGEPTAYYWYSNYSGSAPQIYLGFIPRPNRNATNNFKIYYVPRPATLTDGSQTSDVPVEFQELVVLWATVIGLRTDNRSAAEFEREFTVRLDTMLNFAARGRAGGPRYIINTEYY